MAISTQTVVINIVVHGGGSAQVLNQLGVNTANLGQKASAAAKNLHNLHQSLTVVSKALLSMVGVLIAFNLFITLPQQIARGLVGLAKAALTSADETQRAILSLAGIVATFATFGPNMATSFEVAAKASERLLVTFTQLAAKSLATPQQMMMGFQTFLARGGGEFVKSLEEAAQVTKILVDATLALTQGQQAEKQITTEIGSLMEGQARAGSVLARLIKAQVGDLGAWLEKQKAAGTLLQSLRAMIGPLEQAGEKLGETVTGAFNSIKGSVEILNMLAMRQGGLKPILEVFRSIRDALADTLKELLNTPEQMSMQSKKLLGAFSMLSAAIEQVLRTIIMLVQGFTGTQNAVDAFTELLIGSAKGMTYFGSIIEWLGVRVEALVKWIGALRDFVSLDWDAGVKKLAEADALKETIYLGFENLYEKNLANVQKSAAQIALDIKKALSAPAESINFNKRSTEESEQALKAIAKLQREIALVNADENEVLKIEIKRAEAAEEIQIKYGAVGEEVKTLLALNKELEAAEKRALARKTERGPIREATYAIRELIAGTNEYDRLGLQIARREESIMEKLQGQTEARRKMLDLMRQQSILEMIAESRRKIEDASLEIIRMTQGEAAALEEQYNRDTEAIKRGVAAYEEGRQQISDRIAAEKNVGYAARDVAAAHKESTGPLQTNLDLVKQTDATLQMMPSHVQAFTNAVQDSAGAWAALNKQNKDAVAWDSAARMSSHQAQTAELQNSRSAVQAWIDGVKTRAASVIVSVASLDPIWKRNHAQLIQNTQAALAAQREETAAALRTADVKTAAYASEAVAVASHVRTSEALTKARADEAAALKANVATTTSAYADELALANRKAIVTQSTAATAEAATQDEIRALMDVNRERASEINMVRQVNSAILASQATEADAAKKNAELNRATHVEKLRSIIDEMKAVAAVKPPPSADPTAIRSASAAAMSAHSQEAAAITRNTALIQTSSEVEAASIRRNADLKTSARVEGVSAFLDELRIANEIRNYLAVEADETKRVADLKMMSAHAESSAIQDLMRLNASAAAQKSSQIDENRLKMMSAHDDTIRAINRELLETIAAERQKAEVRAAAPIMRVDPTVVEANDKIADAQSRQTISLRSLLDLLGQRDMMVAHTAQQIEDEFASLRTLATTKLSMYREEEDALRNTERMSSLVNRLKALQIQDNRNQMLAAHADTLKSLQTEVAATLTAERQKNEARAAAPVARAATDAVDTTTRITEAQNQQAVSLREVISLLGQRDMLSAHAPVRAEEEALAVQRTSDIRLRSYAAEAEAIRTNISLTDLMERLKEYHAKNSDALMMSAHTNTLSAINEELSATLSAEKRKAAARAAVVPFKISVEVIDANNRIAEATERQVTSMRELIGLMQTRDMMVAHAPTIAAAGYAADQKINALKLQAGQAQTQAVQETQDAMLSAHKTVMSAEQQRMAYEMSCHKQRLSNIKAEAEAAVNAQQTAAAVKPVATAVKTGMGSGESKAERQARLDLASEVAKVGPDEEEIIKKRKEANEEMLKQLRIQREINITRAEDDSAVRIEQMRAGSETLYSIELQRLRAIKDAEIEYDRMPDLIERATKVANREAEAAKTRMITDEYLRMAVALERINGQFDEVRSAEAAHFAEEQRIVDVYNEKIELMLWFLDLNDELYEKQKRLAEAEKNVRNARVAIDNYRQANAEMERALVLLEMAKKGIGSWGDAMEKIREAYKKVKDSQEDVLKWQKLIQAEIDKGATGEELKRYEDALKSLQEAAADAQRQMNDFLDAIASIVFEIPSVEQSTQRLIVALFELGDAEQTVVQLTQIAGVAIAQAIGAAVAGTESFGKALKKIMAGVVKTFGDYVLAKGLAAIAEGIFPPNPALLAKGAALIALAGVIYGISALMGGQGGRASKGATAASVEPTKPTETRTVYMEPYFQQQNQMFKRIAETMDRMNGTLSGWETRPAGVVVAEGSRTAGVAILTSVNRTLQTNTTQRQAMQQTVLGET